MKIGSYEIQVPFVTTSSDNLKTVLELSDVRKGQRVIDLGSGDGRVVLEFGKAGALVDGYEIKSELVQRSRNRVLQAGLQENIKIYEKSFWESDLSQYDVIYIYGMQSILNRLEEKLQDEMRPGAIFISNIFRLPHWRVKKKKAYVSLYKK